MTDDIYDPLDEYVNTFQPRFEQVAKDTFAQLAKEAGYARLAVISAIGTRRYYAGRGFVMGDSYMVREL